MSDSTIQSSAEALVACVARIGTRGWCDGTAGNFSVKLSRDPLQLLITPSGAVKRALKAEDLLVVDVDANRVGEGSGRPSAETALHVAVVKETSAAAVLHTHSIWGTLLGEHFLPAEGFRIAGYEMLKGIEGTASHDAEVFVPVVANSQDMDALSSELRRRIHAKPETRGLVIAGHGLYTWGSSLAEAERHVEIFEFLFQLTGRRVPLAPFAG